MLYLLLLLAFGTPWARHTIDASSRGADGVRLGDVNGDGRPDVAVGWEQGAVVRIYLHPGPETVKQPWPAVTVGSVCEPEDAVFADLDDDGRVDVVSSCEEGEVTGIFVHWNRPAAWKTEHLPASGKDLRWMFSMPLDVDGDGNVDLVSGGKGEAGRLKKRPEAFVGWFRSPGREGARDLRLWKWIPLSNAGWIMSLIASDMDGDGDLDILLSDRRKDLRGTRWLENPGTGGGSWKNHFIGGEGREVMFLAEANLNGDGLPDVVSAIKPRTVLLHMRGDRHALKWTTTEVHLPPEAGTAKAAEAVDLDLDGQVDLVFTCEQSKGLHGVMVMSRNREGVWQSRTISGLEGIKFDRIELIDLDEDGDLDLLTTEEVTPLGVIWYENPAR
jgi:hypothetical protein